MSAKASEKNVASMMGKTSILSTLIGLVCIVLVAWILYQWGFCRFYVPAGSMAVITSKSGREPKNGALLVERGEKGVWREVLGEGRHFLDPVNYEIKIVPAVRIELGQVGIVTSKIGKELPPGEIIAPDRESKGVWREALGPGLYRLNPMGYQVEIADAINIPLGYVGVVTSQTGKAPRPGEFAGAGEKGVRKDVLQPGLYYINRYAEQVNVIEIGMNQVTMSGSAPGGSVVQTRNRLESASEALKKMEESTLNFQSELRRRNVSQERPAVKVKMSTKSRGQSGSWRNSEARSVDLDHEGSAPTPVAAAAAVIFGSSRAVEFPSRDGFKVSLDMTVEFELLPERISQIYLSYGDLPQVVEKIILPQVLSVSRLKGSSYRAQDFIMGDGREKFQNDLRKDLERILASKHIVVHNAIIRNVEIPQDILKPIQAVSLAREQNLTNVSMQETARKLAELNTETELIEQRRSEVRQETEKLVAAINAARKKEVAAIQAETLRKSAELDLQRSEIEAKSALLRGETSVRVKFLLDNARAMGGKLRSAALGNPALLKDLTMVESLGDKIPVRVIYAGEGTLWTDLTNGAAALPLPGARKK
ncbi:MAG: SPFH domain-containing protein [Victivallaceae bacterium]|nr:SPFH domain-containing protein [Victivallaceae bacterium]